MFSEKRTSRGNNSIIEKIISCPFVFHAYHILYFGTEIAKCDTHCNCVNS